MNESTPMNYPTVEKAAALRESRPLDSAIMNQSEQLSKLSELMSILEDRLQPLVNNGAQSEGSEPDVNEPRIMSSVVSNLSQNTDVVFRLQARVNRLLQDLEV